MCDAWCTWIVLTWQSNVHVADLCSLSGHLSIELDYAQIPTTTTACSYRLFTIMQTDGVDWFEIQLSDFCWFCIRQHRVGGRRAPSLPLCRLNGYGEDDRLREKREGGADETAAKWLWHARPSLLSRGWAFRVGCWCKKVSVRHFTRRSASIDHRGEEKSERNRSRSPSLCESLVVGKEDRDWEQYASFKEVHGNRMFRSLFVSFSRCVFFPAPFGMSNRAHLRWWCTCAHKNSVSSFARIKWILFIVTTKDGSVRKKENRKKKESIRLSFLGSYRALGGVWWNDREKKKMKQINSTSPELIFYDTCLHIDSISHFRVPPLGALSTELNNYFPFNFFPPASQHTRCRRWFPFSFPGTAAVHTIMSSPSRHYIPPSAYIQNSNEGNSWSEWARPSCWLFWTNTVVLCSPWAATCLASSRIWAASTRRWRRPAATKRPTISSSPIITTFPSVASRNKDAWRCISARHWPLVATYGLVFSKYVDSILMHAVETKRVNRIGGDPPLIGFLWLAILLRRAN